MAKKEIRIGLIGFGAMGKTHAYSVANLPYFCGDLPFRARITGVVTRSIEKSRAAADLYGFEHAFTSEAELIASDVDVIDVCTPNVCHAETARMAIAAGKHLYCEKPLCDNYADAADLAARAERSGLICTAVFNNRHHAAVQRAKQLIDEGRLGRILQFDFAYLHASCTDPAKNAGWKQGAELCGRGGVLFDLGSHVIDLAVYLCGAFRRVWGTSQIAFPTRLGADGKPWQTDAPEAFYLTAETESGALGHITASKLATGTNDDLSFTVFGERGALRFSLMQPNYLEFYDVAATGTPLGGTRGFTRIECVGRFDAPAGAFPSPKAPVGWLRGHFMSMYHFLDAVYRGEQNAPSFEDAAYVQLIMDAALRSADTGEWKQVKI